MLKALAPMGPIRRIRRMEQYLDQVLLAMENCPDAAKADPAIRRKIQKLSQYYQSGRWLQDYDRDARGELPAGLKRGVLSQDTLYNLLSEVDAQETTEQA